MLKNLFRGTALLIASFNAAHAQALTFDDYANSLSKHPNVIQIIEQSIQFKELSNGEKGLPSPELIIGIDNMPMNNPSFTRFLPTSKVIGFKQKFPTRGLRLASSEKQRHLSTYYKLTADYTFAQLKASLISQLATLKKTTKLEAFIKRQLEHYQSMEDDLQGQLEVGNPVYGRFSGIDVKRTELQQKLNDLRVERIASEQELIWLVEEIPPTPLSEILPIAWQHENIGILYPVRISAEEVNVSRRIVDIATAALSPTYSVQALYKQREASSTFDGDDWISIQATLSLPLWYNSNQKPKLRAAQAGERSTKAAHENTKRTWLRYMTELEAKRDIAFENIKLLEERKQALQQTALAANRNYESGNIPLEAVLNIQIDELTIGSQLAMQHSLHTHLVAEFNSHIMRVHHADH